MRNIVVEQMNVDVDLMLEEVQMYPDNWFVNTSRQRDIEVQRETQQIILVAVDLQGQVSSRETIDDCHTYKRTPLYDVYMEVTNWLENNFPVGLSRVSIIKMPPGAQVYPHYDEGDYYACRERYHLVLQGSYEYNVDDESIVATKGMLFRFNNKLVHSSKNLSAEDRIAVIFDVE